MPQPHYPSGNLDVLPGNESFIVVAAAGSAVNARIVHHQGGQFGNNTRTSEYGASDSPSIREVANKLYSSYTCTVAEAVTPLESILGLAAYYDIYVKRSSGSPLYDKLAFCLMKNQSKDIPENGANHRTYTLEFSGGVFTAGVALASVPSLAP